MHLVRRRALVAATAAVAALVLGACTAATESGHGSTDLGSSGSAGTPQPSASRSGAGVNPSAPTAKFTDCKSLFRLDALTFPAGRKSRLSFDCATLQVPLDYAKPTGRTIGLQLVRIHDDDNNAHTGSLLVNPGGPGGSGVELVVNLAAQVSDKLLTHFDLIGFDPRGVGLSTPVRCLSDKEKDNLNAASPDVRTAAGFAAAKAGAASIAQACSRKLGSQLPQFNTVQTAKDMERIRVAVGDSKLNYLGFSYGTELGAAYAHLYPQRIRAMVLDGAVDPLTSGITSFATQLQGFEDSFDQFAAWCKVHSPCKSLGNARQAVYAIVAQAKKSPIPSSSPGETRKATSSLVYTGVLSALYSQEQWSSLGSALIDAKRNDSTGLLRLADQYNERYQGHYTNIYDANTTISCNDSKPGPTDATIRATSAQWDTKFPMFGLWSAASLFSCQQWQPDRTVPPLSTAKTAARPILVVGNLHDPATPYQGAKDLTKTLGRAQLLTWDGEGHTSYLQSPCIDAYVNDYLVSGQLPPAGKVCPR
jgi:pimeloyl-ACP methyl ester carboxylesterase